MFLDLLFTLRTWHVKQIKKPAEMQVCEQPTLGHKGSVLCVQQASGRSDHVTSPLNI